MNLTRKTYTTTNEKALDFILGFIGWFVLNGVMGGLGQIAASALLAILSSVGADSLPVENIAGLMAVGLGCLTLLVNVGLVIYFALTRYWIALGALTAFAASLILTLCAAIFFTAVCFAILGGLSAGSGP